ncbi:MAG: preprotein translocase subunit YajC [Raineya sp.]|jgi:preprotein translocase subunit YajC|nr:preprotein translocase subunit YajC [Raineya sp.]
MFQTVLLQTQTTGAQGSSMMSLVFMVGIFVVFYFFMIRPQQRRQKEQVKYREAVKKGDRVVTIGGLHGKIVELNNDTMTLEVDKGVKLTFEKSAISVEGTKRYSADNQKSTTKIAETVDLNEVK